jgi:hypothetical protein
MILGVYMLGLWKIDDIYLTPCRTLLVTFSYDTRNIKMSVSTGYSMRSSKPK